MATIAATSVDISANGDRGVYVWTWAAVTEADTFAAVDLRDYEAAAIEFTGTFGGATVVLQGSVLTTWATLKDLGGTAISATSAAWQSVREQPRYVRPSAGSGSSQSLTATLLVRRKTAAQRV